MIQVPINLIPQLKYNHFLLLFEISTVSKEKILKVEFYVNYFLSLAPLYRIQSPDPSLGVGKYDTVQWLENTTE